MASTVAFFWGVTVASATAALLFFTHPSAKRDAEAERWRARAYEAERQLASLRGQLASVSARLESASESTAVAAFPAQECTPPPAQSSLPQPPPPDFRLPDPARQDEWEALVAGTLQFEVQRRLGRTLPPEQEQRLVETLARLRDASIGLSEEPLDTEEPLSLRDHLTRTIVLLEADRVFRKELGIGVSDFLQGLDSNQIEEVSPLEPASESSP